MAKVKISEFNSNPALNTDIDSINIAEGCSPSGINDAIRELMSQLKDWQSGTSNDPYVVGSSGSLTLNQGTANTVPYLNGSKVVTSGTALSFDGSNLGVGTASPSYKLSVAGNTASEIAIQAVNASNGNTGYRMANSLRSWGVFVNDDSSGPLRFYDYTAGAERMRLDSSGNLGLGVTPNTSWQSTWTALQVGSGISIATLKTNSGNQALEIGSNYYVNAGYKYQASSTATRYEQDGGAHYWYNAPSGTAGNAITWTQAMTLDASGNLLVGTTSQLDGGSITNNYNGNNVKGLVLNDNTPANTHCYIAFDKNSGTQIGTITNNSNTGVLYNVTSDYRLKTVIGAVSGSGERLDALEPIEYEWKETGLRTRGFLAHKFQEVYAGSVTGTKDAVDEQGNPVYQAMQAGSSEVIADLVAEIQSLRKRLADAGL